MLWINVVVIGMFWVLGCFLIFSKITEYPLAWVWNQLHLWIDWHKRYSPYEAVEIARRRTNSILKIVAYTMPILFIALFFVSFEQLLPHLVDIPEEMKNYYLLIGGGIPLVFWALILVFTPLTDYFRSKKYPDTFDIETLPNQEESIIPTDTNDGL